MTSMAVYEVLTIAMICRVSADSSFGATVFCFSVVLVRKDDSSYPFAHVSLIFYVPTQVESQKVRKN